MKISYNWLRTYLPVDLTPERMGEILTQTGLEVEGIARAEAVPGGLEGHEWRAQRPRWQGPAKRRGRLRRHS